MDTHTYLRKLERDMASGFLHLLVLEHIHRLGPIHGYGLIRAMDEATGGNDLWKEGTVYPLLGQLEKHGLLKSQWGAAESGPRRKEYRLTPAGDDMRELITLRWQQLRRRLDSILEGTPWNEASKTT